MMRTLVIAGCATAGCVALRATADAETPKPMVKWAGVVDADCQETASHPWLGDELAVQFQGKVLSHQECRGLRLVLSNLELPDLEPSSCTPATTPTETSTVEFPIRAVARNTEAWKEFLRLRGGVISTRTDVTLFEQGEVARHWPTSVTGKNRLKLYLVRQGWSWAAGLASIGIITLVVVLGWKTNLLRRPTKPEEGRPPFSLSRVQMAWWFVLVALAFLGLTLLFAAPVEFSASALGLLTISGGTKLVRGALEPKLSSDESKGFFADLCYVDGEPNLPRLQKVIWTVILGVLFLQQTAATLVMYELTATMLSLMALSAGTYLSMSREPETTQGSPEPAAPASKPTTGFQQES